MARKFENPEEALKALKNAGWYLIRTTKHNVLAHDNCKEVIIVPKKHRYISKEVEEKVIKALKKTSEEW